MIQDKYRQDLDIYCQGCLIKIQKQEQPLLNLDKMNGSMRDVKHSLFKKSNKTNY